MQLPKSTKTFFNTLYPDKSFINIRCKSDKVKVPPHCFILSKEDYLSDNESISEIFRLNRTCNFGVIACINASYENPEVKSNCFSTKHISIITSQFFEIDPIIPVGLSSQEEQELINKEKQHQWDSIFNAPVKPTMIVETRKSYHVYYKLAPAKHQTSEDMLQTFRTVQEGLIEYFDGDPMIKDLQRPMRLPGFFHNKKDPFPVDIAYLEPHNVYTQQDIIESFGFKSPIIAEAHKTSLYAFQPNVIESGTVKELLCKCEHINHYYQNPTDMGYAKWFGIGAVLTKLGQPGEEAWKDMSRRDSNNFDESEYAKKLEDVKKYNYGCKGLMCDKYTSALKNHLPPPCGVNSPLDFFNRLDNGSSCTSYNHTQAKPEITREQAQQVIKQKYSDILLEGIPGVNYMKIPCGIGKTVGLVEVLKGHLSGNSKKVLWLGDTHKQIEEVSKEFEEFATVHLRSRQNILSVKETCRFVDLIGELCNKEGINGRYTHCLTSRCPLSKTIEGEMIIKTALKEYKVPDLKIILGAKECEYMLQFKSIDKSDIVFGTHSRIRLLGTINPDILVIDENFLKEYKSKIEFTDLDVEYSIKLLESCYHKASCHNKEIYMLLDTLLRNICIFLNADAVQNFLTDKMKKTLSQINEKFKIKTYKSAGAHRSHVKDQNSKFKGCRFIMDYIIYLICPEKINDNVLYRTHLNSLRFERCDNGYSFSHQIQLPSNCVILILDATTPKQLYEMVLKKPIKTYDISENFYIKQESRMIFVNMGKYTKSILCKSTNSDYSLARAVDFITNTVQKNGYSQVGLITFNGVYEILDSYGVDIKNLFRPATLIYEHFNNLRGKNAFRSCDAVFILGFMQYPSLEIAEKARTLLDMEIPLDTLTAETTEDMSSKYLKVPLPLTDPNNTAPVEIKKVNFRYKETSYIYETYCLGELVQAIGRARIYDKRKKRQDVYVMTTMESSGMYRYDEVIDNLGWDKNHKQRAKTIDENLNGRFMHLIEIAKERGLIFEGCKLPPAQDLLRLSKVEKIKIGKNKMYQLYNIYKSCHNKT